MEQSIKLGVVYEHFKGNSYKVLFFAKDSETKEEVRTRRRRELGSDQVWCW